MNKIFTIIFSFLISLPIFAVYPDSFEAVAADNYTIDGMSDEAYWDEAIWYDLQYVWLPYGTTVSTSDFTGRVKLAWTSNRLLVFAEINDNIFSDDHTNATDQYWEDDCLEVFVDEDKSGGDHQNNYNAFAYHVSMFYDVVDLNLSGSPMLYNDHIDVEIRNVGTTHYWEMAIKLFDDSYNQSGSNTPISLEGDKEMGFSMAYCDNDETNGRENFIGLVNLSSADQNRAWQNADVFGTLTLKSAGGTSFKSPISDNLISVFPSVAKDIITIRFTEKYDHPVQIQLFDINGRKVYSQVQNNAVGETQLDIAHLAPGAYILHISGNSINFVQKVYKQ